MGEKPEWLIRFVDDVCKCLHAIDENPPIGCHVTRTVDLWELTLFISPTEVIGGERDGERLPCLYVMDVLQLLPVFDVVETASWQPLPLGEQDDLRSHFAVVGEYEGHSIWLRILSEAPELIPPGRFFDHHSDNIVDGWIQ